MLVSCFEGLFAFRDQANYIIECLIFHDSRTNSWNIFLGEVPCMALVIAKTALYCTDSNFSQKELL